MLSAIYVFGCAFRSIFPRVDVQRFVIFDTWLSSVALGRTVATAAELAFVMQWALLFRELARGVEAKFLVRISYTFVPMIAVAEIFSWYSVLTTSFLGNIVEESLWTLTGALLTIGLLFIRKRARRAKGYLLTLSVLCAGTYVAFMAFVDVPMYVWHFHNQDPTRVLGLWDGIQDAVFRRVPTRNWQDWAGEMPWMSLYFSAAVWISIGMARFPRPSALVNEG
jgi:hypothetical protein